MVSSTPVLPDNAPFSPEQRAWLNGFLAGLFSRSGSAPSTLPTSAVRPLTVLFASQTGTAERLAKKVSKQASKRGFAPTVLDANGLDAARLKDETTLLAVISTYGDGEPPDSAVGLLQSLRAGAPPLLQKLSFSVCALGDSKYAKFCQAGRDVDEALARLGGRGLQERMDCDVGEESRFDTWLDRCLTELAGSTTDPSSPRHAEEPDVPAAIKAKVLSVSRLSGAASAKEVNHVAFSLPGTNVTYTAGDALSVMPRNDPTLVDEILKLLGCTGRELVVVNQQSVPLQEALSSRLDLGRPTKELIALVGAPLTLTPHDVFDVLSVAATKPALEALVPTLKPLRPRLYSISSSPKAHAGEVHLTVGAVRYDVGGRPRKGVCSTFLAERALSAAEVEISIHPNGNFRLPTNQATPIIMVGPGTGIAPFIAFLEERSADNATGANWLFFGDQHEASDFLYRDQLLAWQRQGLLTRLDLAWSRDQTEKIYVQHRLRSAASEIWAWLEAGAHFYVCGDASRMAKDVHAALVQIVAEEGKRSEAEARAYLEKLAAARRYQRDVY